MLCVVIFYAALCSLQLVYSSWDHIIVLSRSFSISLSVPKELDSEVEYSIKQVETTYVRLCCPSFEINFGSAPLGFRLGQIFKSNWIDLSKIHLRSVGLI